VLYSLGHPVAFAALVVSFLLALVLRAIAVRLTARSLGLAGRGESITPRLREDVDPFGAVAAAIGGMGWGKMLTVDDVPRWRGRGRAAAVFAAGPLTCIVVGELILGAVALAYPGNGFAYAYPSDILLAGYGPAVTFGEQVLLSLGVGLLTFGLLALIPIPPLDGFGILHNALRRPGAGIQWMRLWFEEKNIGVVILWRAACSRCPARSCCTLSTRSTRCSCSGGADLRPARVTGAELGR
jgi:Zn-dependent protease